MKMKTNAAREAVGGCGVSTAGFTTVESYYTVEDVEETEGTEGTNHGGTETQRRAEKILSTLW